VQAKSYQAEQEEVHRRLKCRMVLAHD